LKLNDAFDVELVLGPKEQQFEKDDVLWSKYLHRAGSHDASLRPSGGRFMERDGVEEEIDVQVTREGNDMTPFYRALDRLRNVDLKGLPVSACVELAPPLPEAKRY
jgi:hypothetical protein